MQTNMWNARYSEPGYAFGSEPNDFLRSVVDRIPHGPVLCLGEGQGRNAVFLASCGYEVTAMDGSAVGMQRAAALAQARGVTISTTVADLEAYQIEPATWAAIVSIFVHIPLTLRQQVHRRAVAGLRPSGVFVLEGYAPAQLQHSTGGPSSLDRLMALPDLRSELEGLVFEVSQEIERNVIEGSYHNGRAVVVQILGRKP